MGRQIRPASGIKVTIFCFRAFETLHRIPVEAQLGKGCGRIAMLHSDVGDQLRLEMRTEGAVLTLELARITARVSCDETRYQNENLMDCFNCITH